MTIVAHKQAWVKAGVLHRDISVGNVLIIDDEEKGYWGILNDWDMCKFEEELDKGPSQQARSVRI